MNDSPVSPTLNEAIRRYDAAAVEARALVASLPDDAAFHRAAADGGWSVGACLEHLVVSGTKMVTRFEDAVAAARAAGRRASPEAARAPVLLGWFARFFVAGVGRRPAHGGSAAAMKVRTRPQFDPGNPAARGRDRDVVLADFVALQERLAACARAADGLDLAGVKVASVLAGWIRIPLGGWFLAVAGHQERHLDQARATRAAHLAGGSAA